MQPITIQIVAYVALTLASIIVAGVSLFLTYRQSVGWAPILLCTGIGLSGRPDENGYRGHVYAEVWNRRKYPISIRHAAVIFRELEFHTAHEQGEEPAWFAQRTSLILTHTLSIEPNSHAKLDAQGIMKTDSIDAIDDTAELSIAVYDPIKNKHLTLKESRTFRFR